jgi:peptidoglycan/LPS O-acetylase OafA/YrhL
VGTFRLILSLFVVGSHVGGMGDTPAGTTAIAGFFTLSGFLMARTISENYPGRRAAYFYLNRAIRLGPPLAAVTFGTALALWMRDSQPFRITLPDGAYMPVELPPTFGGLMSVNWGGFPLFAYPSFRLLPQAWSLITESAFYLAAPALVLTFGGRVAALRWTIPAASLYLGLSAYGQNWLRSPFAALWVFWLGMQVYFLARQVRVAPVVAAWLQRVAVVLPLVVIAIAFGYTAVPAAAVPFLVPLLVAAWLGVGQWHSWAGLVADRFLGNLSYGVFLGHFLSTITMYWIAEAVYLRTGAFGIFGIPGVTERKLQVSSFCFALLFGLIIYFCCERPMERIRARIRERRTPQVALAAEMVAVR